MIDNFIFLTVMIVVPWFCYIGTKRDSAEKSSQNKSNTGKTK